MPVALDEIKALIERVDNEQRVVLHGVSWDYYEAVLEEIGDSRLIFITFDRGDMELMAPLVKHDFDKSFVARMVELMAFELRINIMGIGSATWRRKDIERGLEADECYYVQNYARMKHKMDIDLTKDPPPDLALEVDATSSSLNKQAVYAALGIPELWRLNKRRLTFYRLKAGKYERSSESPAFPGVTPEVFERFILMQETVDDADVMQAWVKWVRKNLKRARKS